MLIINAEILTMDGAIRYKNGFVLTRGKKIAAVGDMKDAPPNSGSVIDAKGGFVVPGFIDAHCHLGMFGDSIGFEGIDGNEKTDPITPHLRAIDAINPNDGYFKEAREGGVTTVVTGPGSSNVVGGQTAAVKTNGIRIDNMIVKAPCSLKCAFGENPKKTYNEKSKAPVTRMATAALLREALFKAQRYAQRISKGDTPEFDIKSEALLSVLEGGLPIHAHAHRADDIFTAIRIGREFGIEVKIVHATEGHLIAGELAKEGVDVMVGPSLSDRSKPELKGMSFKTAARLQKAGVRVAIITDHPVVPVNYLLLCAQLAAKEGMPPDAALRAITCDAAEIAGIGGRVGKIKKGYDADLLIFNKNPMDFNANLLMTIIDGVKVNK